MKCQCCGSRTGVTRYLLRDGRTHDACATCSTHCKYCVPHLKDAKVGEQPVGAR